MDMDQKTIAFLANEITRAYMTGKNIGSQEEFAREYFKMYQNSIKVISAETIKMEFAQHNSCVITINGSDEVLYFILPVKQIG